jgi:glycosyltransferase involved in cell wall biosynthesis
VHRLGYRNDIARLLNEVDALVHPAHEEPLGRVLLEAAASGTPIIATDVGGTREIVRHRESALLIPPGNPRTLADAIFEMSADPALRARLSGAARARATDDFDIARAAARQADIWNEVARVRV